MAGRLELPKLEGHDIQVPGDATLDGCAYHAVVMESTGLAGLANSAGEVCLGITQGNPSGIVGDPVTVRTSGATWAMAGGTTAIGAELSATTAGHLDTASAAHYVVAIGMNAGASGSLFRVLLVGPYQKNA
jgi:hypothetical protein